MKTKGDWAMKNNSLIKGAAILTFAGLITRLLGFIYRIYMTNVMGSECIGLYQLIMPVYTLAWSISCAGFTTTISKLVAAQKAQKKFGDMHQTLKQCIFMSVGIGIFLNIILYFGAQKFSLAIFHDERTILSLKILAFSFPFMAAGSCIRGYFLGLQQSSIPAISQVLEQFIHMGTIYFFIGKINHHIEYTCALAVAGIMLGELFSFIYVYLAYKNFECKQKSIAPTLNFFSTFSSIISMTIPLTANKVTASFLTAIENILIPQRLLLNGFSFERAISIYGQITGMAMPLIYFPSVFLMSLSISLVPEVSQSYATKNNRQINYTVSKTILFTSIIGMGSAIFFIMFPKEIGFFIYHQDISQMLRLLGFMCPLLYLQIILSGILNGLGHQMFIFKNNLLSSFINLFFIYFIIPYRGINAFIIGWFISLIISCLLNLNMITKSISINLKFDELILKPILAMLATGLVVRLIATKFIFVHMPNIFGLFICAAILGATYLFFIISVGCISFNDFKSLAFTFSLKRKSKQKETNKKSSFLA